MKYEKIAKRIADASKNNSLTFFVGAGVSKCSGVPSWGELIEKMCAEMGRKVPDNFSSDEYLSIPQMFSYSIKDREKYRDFVKKAIDKPNITPNEVHRLMLKFHPASFLTTNYDSLIENAAIKYGQSYKCIAMDEEVPSINGDHFILKVHGDLEHDNFVLKEEDYLAYEESFKLISTLMRSVFSTNTVVFIGYRIGDYNIKLILDWVKRVLKDKFNPIFIRTETDPLPTEEREYYESRGLDVVELSRIVTPKDCANFPADDYVPRYSAVLNYIDSITKEKVIGENAEDSFSILFNRLVALDKLSALRVSDIRNRLQKCCNISDTGIIYVNQGQEELFRKFISIHEIPADKQKSISENDLRKYRLIRRVLSKGGVYQIEIGHKRINFYDERISFADDKCIVFDYSGMATYCNNGFSDVSAKCKRAFYLTRLHRYEEAFDAFFEIAKESFSDKDYVHFYIAEVNCIVLRKVLSSSYVQVNKDNSPKKKEEELILWEDENRLFDSLPQEFKHEYKSIRDLSTNDFLYQYGFESLMDAKKLEDSLTTHSIEMGETSSGKVTSRINDYLHFLLGNGICLDVYSEYKATVCALMSELIQKYTDRQKNTLRDLGLFEKTESKIYFDQYDFYCFVRFFNASDLEKVLADNRCEIMEFKNMDCIEQAIHNLLVYTEKTIKSTRSRVEIESMILETKTCLTMARHMQLSKKIVEEICRFIFNYNLPDITIDQKVLFLDSQVYCRNVSNTRIQKILEDALIKYLDGRVKAINENTRWESFSKSARINYPNIADYLIAERKPIISRRLSKRVAYIIDNNITQMQKEAVEHYSNHVSRVQKQRIVQWIERILDEGFDFERYTLLIEIDEKKARNYSEQLFSFLKDVKKRERDIEIPGMESFPKPIPNEELLNVGFWCMCGILDSKNFLAFKGVNSEFDFLIDAMNFDYSKFNVGWLLRMDRRAIKAITKKATVKGKLTKVIIQELSKDQIKQDERERLVRILEFMAD